MKNGMEVVAIDLMKIDAEKLQSVMDAMNDATCKHIEEVMQDLNVSYSCASDIVYLRSRSRWNENLEKELIQLHKDGKPPNVSNWP